MMKPFTAWIQVDKKTGEAVIYFKGRCLLFLNKKDAQIYSELRDLDKIYEVIQVEIKQMLYKG